MLKTGGLIGLALAVTGMICFSALAAPGNGQFMHRAAATTPISDAVLRKRMSILPTLVANRQFALARAVLARAVEGRPAAALHRAHLEGLILEQQGRTDAAIKQFRAILARAPSFLPSRVELAKALYRTGQMDAADTYFEAIALGTDDTGLKRLAESFRTQIRKNRPYGATGYVSVLPSTNINKGTSNGTFRVGDREFTISDQSREKSGIGAGFGFSAYRTWQTGPASAATLAGSIDGKKYSSMDAYDELTVTFNPSLRREIGAARLSFGPLLQHQWVSWDPYLLRYGAVASLSRPLSPHVLFSTNLTFLKQDYRDRDYRDGWLARGSASLRYFFSTSFSVAAKGRFTAERTQRDDLDHNDYRAELTASREWSGGLLTSVFAAVEKHRYLGPFPTTTIERSDTEFDIGASLASRTISYAGFAPKLTYQFTDQHSNVSFFDYQSHDVALSLTHDF